MKNKKTISRREIVGLGLSAIGGMLLPSCSKSLPPTYGNLLRMGDSFTYFMQRSLLSRKSLAKEYRYGDISSFPAIGTTNPADPGSAYYSIEHGPVFDQLQKDDFHEWKLTIEGRVARPGFYSLTALHKFSSRTQITRHTCEEGWSAIAEWTGAPLGLVLEHAGILPEARFISFYAYDDIADSIDMLDAFHPQTLLAYGMNGRPLSIPHGGPVRLRVEKQLGYKSMKYLRRIVVTNEFDDLGALGTIQNGWSWFAGI